MNGLPTANPVDTYTVGGYGDASATPNDPTKVPGVSSSLRVAICCTLACLYGHGLA